MTTNALRPELPPLPDRIRRLPVDARGYPVPWFVAWIDGTPEFRVFDTAKLVLAVKERRCWVCGLQLGGFLAFTIGPMCAVNRISAEPPAHRTCAEFSAIACPFLTRPHMRRRDHNMPDGSLEPGGLAIQRNPGTVLVWITRRYKLVPIKGRPPLFRMGDPLEVLAFSEGRPATRDQIRESVVSGLPVLRDEADAEGPGARKALAHQLAEACALLEIAPVFA